MRSYSSNRIPSFCQPVGISAVWIDSTGVVFDLPKMARERAVAGEEFVPEDHEEWGGKDISEAMFAKLNAKLREARTLRTLRGLVRALLT